MADFLQHSYSLEEMKGRMRKAEKYIAMKEGSLTECKELLRDKSCEYFDEIINENGGKMEPYTKDSHGDQRSPINNKLKGLFFCTDADFMASLSSIYGPKRLTVQASALIDSTTRAFFADFYCVPGKGQRPHYITIVLTKEGSEAYRFCLDHLPELHLSDNRFFTVEMDNQPRITARAITGNFIHVELFYTESVNIKYLMFTGQATLADVPVARARAQHRAPRAKSDGCPHCD